VLQSMDPPSRCKEKTETKGSLGRAEGNAKKTSPSSGATSPAGTPVDFMHDNGEVTVVKWNSTIETGKAALRFSN